MDRMSLQERLLRAYDAGHLGMEPDRRHAADYLAAAGMAGQHRAGSTELVRAHLTRSTSDLLRARGAVQVLSLIHI